MHEVARQPCDERAMRERCRGTATGAGGWVLVVAIMGSSITFLDGTVVNVALPVLQRELAASVGQVQWVVESYALMLAALMLVGGALGDRYGRRRVFTAGIALFGLASLGCGLAPGPMSLIVARAAQGLAAALLVPGSLSLITSHFDAASRGRAIGTWSAMTSIAAGFGPVLGGWLVESVSWRWIFWINVPLVAVVLAIVRRVPESRDEHAAARLDIAGALLATLGLGAIVFALIEAGGRGGRAPVVAASLVAGALAVAAFVVVEWRRAEPMLPLALFRSRAFTGANVLTLFLYAALGGVLFFLPFNLIQIQGWSAAAAGAALLPFVATMGLLSRWAGGLVERHGSKRPLVIGPAIAGIGFALFAWPGAPVQSYWTSFFPAVMVMSIGMAIAVAPLTTTVMGAVDASHSGLASGVNNAVSRVAQVLSVAVFGVVLLSTFPDELAAQLGKPEQPGDALREAFVAGFRRVAFLGAALAGLSALAAAWLIPARGDDGNIARNR
jgi:EmrB/QacA subfamily drug resistance transporter